MRERGREGGGFIICWFLHLSPGFKAYLAYDRLFCPLISGAKSDFNSENLEPFSKCHMTSFYFNLTHKPNKVFLQISLESFL